MAFLKFFHNDWLPFCSFRYIILPTDIKSVNGKEKRRLNNKIGMCMEVLEKIESLKGDKKTLTWDELYDTLIEEVQSAIKIHDYELVEDEGYLCYTLAQNIYWALTDIKPIGNILYHLWDNAITKSLVDAPKRQFLEWYLHPNPRKRKKSLKGMLDMLQKGHGLAPYRPKPQIVLTEEEKEQNRKDAKEIRKMTPSTFNPWGSGNSLNNQTTNKQNNQDMTMAKQTGQLDSTVQFTTCTGRGFNDIAGMEQLKQQMREEVMWPLLHKEIAQRYRIHVPNGMLLYGPPGCGKTFFARKLAEECQLPFAYLRGSDLGNIYFHGTQTMIADMFQKAEANAPCILFLDEVDAIIGKRGSTQENTMLNQETTEFLTQMNNCSERGIFIIAATNHPENIDPAALRSGRIDKFVMIPLPDEKTREQLILLELKGRPCDGSQDFPTLAQLTEGATCSDIALIVNNTALQAAMRDKRISQDMLVETIQQLTHQNPEQEDSSLPADPPVPTSHPQKIGFLAAHYQVVS